MRSRAILLPCLCVALCAGAAAAAPQAPLRRLFPHEAPIQVGQDGLTRLLLPPEVIAECRPDLSDLRVFDENEREVAYLVDAGRGLDVGVEVTETFEPRVLGLDRQEHSFEHEPPLHREVYELEAPPGPPEAGRWELVIDAPEARFVRQVAVEAVAADGSKRALVESSPLFSLDARTRRTRIPLPELDAPQLAVTIEGREGGFLQPHFRFEAARTLRPPSRAVVTLESASIRRHDGRTIVELQRPSGIVPDLLEVSTSTSAFRRRVRVWDVQPGGADVELGDATLYRVDSPRGVDHRSLALRRAEGAALRVEIEDGDSPPLREPRFEVVVRQPVLVFALPAGARAATLRFGGGRAHRPDYDLAGLLIGQRSRLSGDPARAAARLYDPAELAFAELGAIRANPAFDAAPALAFAMHPGAEIDVRLYDARRALSIEPSAEGLSRLRLAPEDLAASRPDLADVRVVDSEGRQWPYLLDRRGFHGHVALGVASVEQDDGASVYRLALPVAPLPVDALALDFVAPYFHRRHTLVGLDEKGERLPLSTGSVVKDARNPRPVVLSFRATRVHALELRIEDGDDAPLPLAEAEARLRQPELFLAAPAGSYALLVGQPDATAPQYELERVREVVLAVASNPVVTGPLEDNPGFSTSARLHPGSDLLQRTVVWAVLVIAALFLGVLTLRLARQQPAPDHPTADSPDG